MNNTLALLIECCQISPNTANLECLTDEVADWGRLISSAHRHGVLPLVYQALRDIPTVPQSAKASLKSHHRDIAMRNMAMSAELLRIMGLLADHDISALAFKGPVLSQMIYGDITTRQYGDLDIFVRKEDIVRIADILSKDRYDARVDSQYFSNSAFLNLNSDCQFFHKQSALLIEIHWSLFRKTFSNKMHQINLWDQTQKASINNHALSTFATEALLLYLCMHGSKHMWERLEWIADIDRLIRISNSLNWERVYTLARYVNGHTMLELGMFLSAEFFQTPLPEEIKKQIYHDQNITQLASDVLGTLDREKSIPDTEMQYNYRHFRFHLALNDTAIDKLYFILQTLFTLKSGDVETVNLPNKLFFFYYLVRPFRLIGKYIKKIFGSDNH